MTFPLAEQIGAVRRERLLVETGRVTRRGARYFPVLSASFGHFLPTATPVDPGGAA